MYECYVCFSSALSFSGTFRTPYKHVFIVITVSLYSLCKMDMWFQYFNRKWMPMNAGPFSMLIHGSIQTQPVEINECCFFPFRYVSQRCLHGTAREWIQWSNLWIQFLRIRKSESRGRRVASIPLRNQLIKWRGFIQRTTLALTSKVHLQGRNRPKSDGIPALAL